MNNAIPSLEMPIPFGIFADTGQPLPELEAADIAALAAGGDEPPEEARAALMGRGLAGDSAFATVGDISDPNDLAQAGWGVIFAANADPRIKEALQRLLDQRKDQAGETLFKIFEGPDGYRPGDTAAKWLERHNVSLNVVDPYQGVPFYLLLIGSPEEIPYEFQYTLDIYWAVGRLHFASLDDYRRYAESVVAYEEATTVPHRRELALFAPTHDFDRATQLFTNKVALPLSESTPPWGRLGEKQRFALQPFIGKAATKSAFTEILRGRIPGGPSALLFSGSHGMAFRPDDPRLSDTQGALVCQNWEGYGNITDEHWFAAKDIPADAQVHGLIYFVFACYGAGCPQYDNFSRKGAALRQIAPRPLIARLPQALLSHPNGGALATLGHVDRAWGYSFLSARGGAQVQGFRDVLGRLLRGERIGQATDQFNIRWAALSTELANALDDSQAGARIADAELANQWVARNDARNYLIFGDPAVRLRVEDMPLVGPP